MGVNDFGDVLDGVVRPAVAVGGSVVWCESADPKLRAGVEAGRPLLVAARNSDSSGRRGASMAAQDLWLAAAELVPVAGFDIRPLLPSVEVLVELLMTRGRSMTSQTVSGDSFTNRLLLLDFSQWGLYVSLSTGSARKLNEEFDQPHVEWLAALQRALQPIGLFARRLDRLNRSTWATGRILLELRWLESQFGEVWAVDCRKGRWDIRPDMDVVHLVDAQSSEREALILREKKVSSVRFKSGMRMENGSVDFAAASAAPAGFFRWWNRRTKRTVLSVETPGCYPDSDVGSDGVPNVRFDSDALVDQVENIRYALARVAQSNVSWADLAREMVDRRYSTEAFRDRGEEGPEAYRGSPSRVARGIDDVALGAEWLGTLFGHVELYRTGVLRRRFGDGPEDVLVISNCFPPDGRGWASEEDFGVIEAKLAANQLRAEKASRLAWSGMPVLVDGVPGRLRGMRAWRGPDCGWLVMPLVKPEGYRSLPAVPDRVLVEGLLDAVLAADGAPLREFAGAAATDDREARRLARQGALETTIVAQQRAQEQRFQALLAVPASEGAMSSLRRRLSQEYAELGDELVRLSREADEVRSEAVTKADQIAPDAAGWSALLTDLRSPDRSPSRDALRRAVRNLTVTSSRVLGEKGRQGVVLRWSGELVVDTGCGVGSVPFGFDYESGAYFAHRTPEAAGDRREAALASLGRLRRGVVGRIPQRSAGSLVAASTSADAADALGVARNGFVMALCDDPSLLRVGMAALYPEPADGEDPSQVLSVEELATDPVLAGEFGDVTALAARMRLVHSGRRRPMWLQSGARVVEVGLLVRAAVGGSDTAPTSRELQKIRECRMHLKQRLDRAVSDRWDWGGRSRWPKPHPCRFCGASVAAVCKIREVTGYLCMNPECRRDQAGVTWPTRFDRFVAGAAQWQAAGYVLDLPDSADEGSGGPLSTTTPLRPSRRGVRSKTVTRREGDLSVDEKKLIADAYLDRTVLTNDICRRHRIDPPVLYRILAALDVPLRRSRGPRLRVTV